MPRRHDVRGQQAVPAIYAVGGENACKAEFLGNLAQFRDELTAQGREVVYYGDRANLKDRYAVIMHWKLSGWQIRRDSRGPDRPDGHARTLITLQDHMLQERKK